jgi:hypothetical protein
MLEAIDHSSALHRWPSHSSAALSDMLSSTIKQRELANSIAAANRTLQGFVP